MLNCQVKGRLASGRVGEGASGRVGEWELLVTEVINISAFNLQFCYTLDSEMVQLNKTGNHFIYLSRASST